MTDTEIVVPWLRQGTGTAPADGGCILQVIDWIDRQSWTDSPECVHPVFRHLAIAVNDSLPDDERQKLLDLVPRLMGTNSGDKVLTVGLATWCARVVLPIFERAYPANDRPRRAIEEAEAWVNCPCDQHAISAVVAAAAAVVVANAAVGNYSATACAASAAAFAFEAADAVSVAAYALDASADAALNDSAAYASAAYQLLIGCLDEYDRLAGRNRVNEQIDWSGVCEVIA